MIPHEFVVCGPRAAEIHSAADRLALVWPQVAEEFERAWEAAAALLNRSRARGARLPDPGRQQVFHTMSATAWPSVQRHGLLSARQLIDLFGLDVGEGDRLLSAPRKQSTVLRAPGLSPAVIRDQ
ncbi:DUF7002 family protein [Micromonospora sp. SD19]